MSSEATYGISLVRPRSLSLCFTHTRSHYLWFSRARLCPLRAERRNYADAIVLLRQPSKYSNVKHKGGGGFGYVAEATESSAGGCGGGMVVVKVSVNLLLQIAP